MVRIYHQYSINKQMNTIQTQVSIVHLSSGLNLSSAAQRDADNSSFAADVVTLDLLATTLSMSGIAIPRQVMIKHISGDPISFGFDGTNYHLQLSLPGETMLLTFNPADTPTIYVQTSGSAEIAVAIASH